MAVVDLSANELETLRILWERGELKPGDIQEHFSWPIENATLRSTLVNLVDKKHLTRRLDGKAFYYATRVPKATTLQAMMDNLARIFAGGSHHELVAQLVETGDIKPEDIKLMRQASAGRSPTRRKKS